MSHDVTDEGYSQPSLVFRTQVRSLHERKTERKIERKIEIKIETLRPSGARGLGREAVPSAEESSC